MNRINYVILFLLLLAMFLIVIDPPASPRDYQLQLNTTADSMQVYEGNRYIGSIPFRVSEPVTALDSLISEDNH